MASPILINSIAGKVDAADQPPLHCFHYLAGTSSQRKLWLLCLPEEEDFIRKASFSKTGAVCLHTKKSYLD